MTFPAGSSPTSLAVDAANGFVYVGDAGTVSRVDYFNATTCNASVTTGCSTTPATVAVGQDPVSLVVDDAAGGLYVANAGTGGGISVVSLSTHTLTTTISTGQPTVNGIAGIGLVQSVGLSPGGNQVLAVLDGLSFPGDVLATINPTTQSDRRDGQPRDGYRHDGSAGQRRHPRLCLGHRPHQQRRRRPEPEPRRL